MNLSPAPLKNLIFALCYELLLLVAVSCVGLFVAAPFAFFFKSTPNIASTVVGIILLLAWYIYLVGTWKKGQTLPMKTWHLVIKTTHGNRPTLKHLRFRFLWAVILLVLLPSAVYLYARHMGYAPKLAAGLSSIWLILPYGWWFVGKQKQTLYDFLSNTKLMKKND